MYSVIFSDMNVHLLMILLEDFLVAFSPTSNYKRFCNNIECKHNNPIITMVFRVRSFPRAFIPRNIEK